MPNFSAFMAVNEEVWDTPEESESEIEVVQEENDQNLDL